VLFIGNKHLPWLLACHHLIGHDRTPLKSGSPSNQHPASSNQHPSIPASSIQHPIDNFQQTAKIYEVIRPPQNLES
jgi:hypothetical protein